MFKGCPGGSQEDGRRKKTKGLAQNVVVSSPVSRFLHNEASRGALPGFDVYASPEREIIDWTVVASLFANRSNKDCRKRWINNVVGGLKKGSWDADEDEALRQGVQLHGILSVTTGPLLHL